MGVHWQFFLIGFAIGAVAMWLYFAQAGLIRSREEWLRATGRENKADV